MKDLIWVPLGSSSSSSLEQQLKPVFEAAATNLVRVQHGYDRASNRLWRKDLLAESYGAGFDELYSYDGLYRLKIVNRGTLNSTQTGILSGSGTFNQCWTLDATGNWKGFREDDNGGGIWNLVQSRSANPVNEISGITNSVGAAWAQPAYDKAGNMTTIPQPANPSSTYTATYDAWNRLVKLIDPSNGNTVQTNAYDGRNYRTIRNSFTAGVLSETRHYFYTASWQSIEDRVGASSTAQRQSIWGLRFLDDLVLRDRDTTDSGTRSERIYALHDPLGSVVAIVNSAGIVQERYVYSPYGAPFFLSSTFALQTSTLFDWETLLASYRADLATGLILARDRILNYSIGTWLTRDPLSYTDSSSLYQYVDDSPATLIDPLGRGWLVPAIGGVAIVGVWLWKDTYFNYDYLTAGESATIASLLEVLSACAPRSDTRLNAAFKNCSKRIWGKWEPGADPKGPEGGVGTSLTVDPGWAWRVRIYLASTFFESTRCNQLKTLVKECYIRAELGNYDDTGMSDNLVDNAFSPLECCLACCGTVNPSRWPRGGTSCCCPAAVSPPKVA